jgi:two-component system NtrC family response regulator
LLDLALPPSFEPDEGLKLLESCPAVPVIVLTGHGNRELSLHAIEQGAWDFITKPVDPDMLKVVVERALKKHRLEEEVRSLRSQVSPENLGIIGNSKSTQELRSLIRRIAPSDINVMILGPSGTGKELVARAIHKLSSRNLKPFIPLHCGAIPGELLESELFGHLKGSFTGADRDKPGLLETANGGTLFMDEIGEMPQNMQVKLLRFLQEGSFTPVGGREERQADLRIITATHRDLEKMVKEIKFREDLYYRLKGMIIRTLSLKERIEDIPILANSFLQRFSPGKIKRLTGQTMDWLLKQPWKGNVRELENLLECTIVLSGDRPEVTTTGQSLNDQVRALEKRLILAALEEMGHNHTKVAKLLGISRPGLLKKMTRLGLR